MLSVLALLSALALTVMSASRRHGQLVQRSFESYRAQEAADGALRLTLLELSMPAQRSAAEAQQHDRVVDVAGQVVAVSYEDEPSQSASTRESGHVIRMRACAAGAEHTQLCRIAIVRLTGNWAQPLLVYAWHSELP